MTEQFCRVTFDENKQEVQFESATSNGSINEIIESDKRFGTLSPRNGKYFTFQIMEVLDKEVDRKFVRRAYIEGWRRWTNRINVTIKEAKRNEEPDFKVIFRTTSTDERKVMKDNTIMYHYFPIHDLTNPKRGLCVVNPKFFYTNNGKSVSIIRVNPDSRFPNSTITTIDMDQVFGHEDGHGLGLPHDPEKNNIMSTPHSSMAEWLSERDIIRGISKYGIKIQKLSRFLRFFKYIRYRSENY